METVLKTVVPAMVPWVRIPPLPPNSNSGYNTLSIAALKEKSSQHGGFIPGVLCDKKAADLSALPGEVPKWLKGTVC